MHTESGFFFFIRLCHSFADDLHMKRWCVDKCISNRVLPNEIISFFLPLLLYSSSCHCYSRTHVCMLRPTATTTTMAAVVIVDDERLTTVCSTEVNRLIHCFVYFSLAFFVCIDAATENEGNNVKRWLYADITNERDRRLRGERTCVDVHNSIYNFSFHSFVHCVFGSQLSTPARHSISVVAFFFLYLRSMLLSSSVFVSVFAIFSTIFYFSFFFRLRIWFVIVAHFSMR